MDNVLKYFYHRSGMWLSVEELCNFCHKMEPEIKPILDQMLNRKLISTDAAHTDQFTISHIGKEFYLSEKYNLIK